MEEGEGVREKKTRKRQERKGEKEKTMLYSQHGSFLGSVSQSPAKRVAWLEAAGTIFPGGFLHTLPSIQPY